MSRTAFAMVLLAAMAGCRASAVVHADGSGGTVNPSGGSGGRSSGSGGGSGGKQGGGAGGSAGSTVGAGAGGDLGTGGTTDQPSSRSCAQAVSGAPVLRLLTNRELQNSLDDIFPEVKGQWTPSLPANGLSSYGFDNDAQATVGAQLVSGLLDTAQALATALVGTPLVNVLPCSANTANHACAETFLNKYGRRLFRRSLKSSEHDQYLAFFDQALAKSDFKTALKWMTIGLIQSPNAIYRSEVGVVQGTVRKLAQVELATELSYAYTGTTPTDDLLTKAENGTMDPPAKVAAAMVATTAGKEALQRFFAAYFDYSNVTSIQKTNVPNFPALSADMVQETRHFIDDVVFQKKGGLKELLTSSNTNPSKALATFYSFPAPASDFDSVARPAGRGIGLLAQGAFLSVHAASDGSSPTRRGLFPFLRLLCMSKPSPPPGVPPIPSPAPGKQTTRQRYELSHASSEPCASCHKLFDPLGFGFEHFNEAGQFRETESGLAIDASGTYTPAIAGAQTFSFSGQEDLAKDLAQLPDGHQCVANYLATYAFGTAQSCLGPSAVPDLQSGKIGLVDAFVNLANEPHFGTRGLQ